MIDIKPAPSFERFLDTLTLQKAYRRPPLFDFGIAPAHRAAVIGHEPTTAQDEVDFWRMAGYDYVLCTFHCPPLEETRRAARYAKGGSAHFGNAVITDLEQFRREQWSWQPAARGDLSALDQRYQRLAEIIKLLPPEMKLVLHTADIFTYAWELIGFTNFAIKTLEEPQLLHEVMCSLADAQINCLKRSLEIAGDACGALFYSDDIAYTEGLMMSPDFYQRELFPHIRRVADLGMPNRPLIYHTDGRLYDVFDQLAMAGVRGIQPLEPKSMDPLAIKRRWPGKFCLLGNIDLNLLAQGEPSQVRAHVYDRVDKLNVGGGYMPGVSNTVPFYVKFENYKCMIETVYSYGDPVS